MHAHDAPPPRQKTRAPHTSPATEHLAAHEGVAHAAEAVALPEASPPPPWFPLAQVGVTAAVLGVLSLLALAVPAMWVAGGAAACTVGAAADALRRVKAAGERLGWRIESEDDLQLARAIAEMDMKSAAILIARLSGVLAFCLLSGQLLVGLSLAALCVAFGPCATRVEGRFQAMRSGDPLLSARFSRIVRAWKEPRWSLPPEV